MENYPIAFSNTKILIPNFRIRFLIYQQQIVYLKSTFGYLHFNSVLSNKRKLPEDFHLIQLRGSYYGSE